MKRYENIKLATKTANDKIENEREVLKAHLSKGNSKTQVKSFDTAPEFTCDKKKACYQKGCYAKNLMRYKGVMNAYIRNSLFYIKKPKECENSILNQIPMIGMFRWHVSGDILNAEYFNMMIRIAETRPNVKFMAFTKKFEIVNDWIGNNGNLPENLNIVFSHWKGESVPNQHNLPLAMVRFKKEENEHLNGDFNVIECPSSNKEWTGSCATCAICWTMGKNNTVVFNQH